MSTTLIGSAILSLFFLAMWMLCSKVPETKAGKQIHEEMLKKAVRSHE